jgi:hypothetical protein
MRLPGRPYGVFVVSHNHLTAAAASLGARRLRPGFSGLGLGLLVGENLFILENLNYGVGSTFQSGLRE